MNTWHRFDIDMKNLISLIYKRYSFRRPATQNIQTRQKSFKFCTLKSLNRIFTHTKKKYIGQKYHKWLKYFLENEIELTTNKRRNINILILLKVCLDWLRSYVTLRSHRFYITQIHSLTTHLFYPLLPLPFM